MTQLNSPLMDVLPAANIDDTEAVKTEQVSGSLGESTDSDSAILSDDHEIHSSAISADLATAETLSPTCKIAERKRLEDELAQFLAKGGAIKEVTPSDVHLNA